MIRRRLLTGTASYVIARFTTAGLWFALTPLLLAQVGPTGYALWVLMAAVGSYGALLDLGIGGAVVKYIAEHTAREEHEAATAVLASAQWVYLLLAIATIGVSLLVAPIFPGLLHLAPEAHPLASRLVILTGIFMALMILFSPYTAALRGLQRHDLFNAVEVTGSVVLAAMTIFALLQGWGVTGVIAMNIPANIVTGGLSVYLCRRVAPGLGMGWRQANIATARRLASLSTSMFAIDVAQCLRTRSDAFIIAVSLPVSAVTPFSLARRLGDVTEMAARQFVKVVLPLASELDAGRQGDKLHALFVIGSRVTLAATVPVAVILSVLAGPILTLWVGAEYAQHAPLVAILAAASVCVTSQAPAAEILQGMGRHRFVASTTMASAVGSIALSLLLLPVFGLLGVALGALMPAVIASLGVLMPYAHRTLQVSWWSSLRKIWLPGLVPGAAAAAMLWALQLRSDAPSVVVLVSWAFAAALVYGVGYLAMPASAAERELLSDAAVALSARLPRRRIEPSGRLG